MLRQLTLAAAGAIFSIAAWAQAPSEAGRPAAILPIESEAPPGLVVYPALPEPLARGVIILQHRTENFRIIPIFGKEASEVSPRVGHLHVTVDDGPGTWAHTSGDPIIVVGLKPGPHKLRVELADPTHKILGSQTVEVTVPEQKAAPHKH
ncbi:DUF6130 family protein [Variovorax sp. JS1663]|uniref:DUF6130 family protein n=1 Tax=Variovorax sp. JS1663 TaxID=1851577 RepID=UPI000B341F28|nr:DUF6130 family protein [Variovorax sp. JS1663]OUM03949.1 hypothetical protein A8M77_02730 [Variovorax sp. JS1663]